MRYLLDTNTCIHALKSQQAVLARLLAVPRSEVAVGVISEAELRLGAAKSSAAKKTGRLVENFLTPLTIVPFTSDDAATYAVIRAGLEKAGTPIGPLDTLIAAQAVSRDLILVTSNEREFRRVRGLAVENWLVPGR